MLLLGGLELVTRPGIFAIFDFYKMDMSPFLGQFMWFARSSAVDRWCCSSRSTSPSLVLWYLSWRGSCSINNFGSDQDGIWAATSKSVPVREAWRKKPFGWNPICCALRYLQVLLGQAVFAAYVQRDNASFKRGFTNSFHDKPASYIMSFSDHVREGGVLAA